MATTDTTTGHANQTTTYSVLVVFTVDPHRDEHLQNPQAIRDEATSWLHSLDATVHHVTVRTED